MKSLLIFFLFIGISFGAPLEGPGRIGDDLPELKPYQPEKQPNVPIKLGHRSKYTTYIHLVWFSFFCCLKCLQVKISKYRGLLLRVYAIIFVNTT